MYTTQFNSYPLDPGPQPNEEVVREAKQKATSGMLPFLSDAPEPLEDSLWVGREDFLSTLNYDWINSATCVMGLIGFAGEGKSSLARRWLNNLLDDTYLPQPDGVFWWNFYDRSKTVDLFLEKAIYYLCQGQADVNTLTSAYSKAEFLAGILKAGRYLFVLDGLERVQYLSGEDYGLLKSNDLAKFLNYFASGEHQSFCLITSRAPVIDLIPYTAYDDCEVSSLSNSEGRQLLKQLGVKGNILDLLRLVDDWQGHALTLNLIGDHLRETHEGYICHISKLPPPARQDDPYGLVHRVMEPYDDHLTEPEQEFMKKFSAFRLTVPKSALKAALQAPDERVNQLLKYRLLQKDRQEDNYTAHPLITNYYLDKLKQDSTYSHTVYNLIKDYYLSQVKSLPSSPTLEALAPLIEAVHYCCKAGNYDEANRLRTEPDSSGTSLSRKLIELGADDTHLNLLQDFFSNNGTVENSSLQPISQLAVLLEIAECLMRLGRLSEALSPLEQYIRLAKEINDPYSLVKGYLTSAKVFVYLGKFTDAETTSIEALDLAQVTKNSSDERTARIYQGLIAYCKGQKKSASHAFEQANKLAEFYHGKQYLRDIQGIIYADYLRRLPELDKTQQSRKANLLDQAQQIMETNLASEKKAKELRLERDDYCRIHRVLGDLAAARQQHEEARHHYEEAVEVVRAINHRPALASILTARGRWAAQLGDVKAAWKDLQEALDYTLAGGYRLTEVDIYVGQAWVHLAEDNLAATQEKAKQAVSLSQKVDAPSGEGYYWGQQEAEEVLKAAQVRHQKNA